MYNIKYSLIISSFIGFLFMNGNIFAQEGDSDSPSDNITLSGTVTDASSGKALAGANVVVEGTDSGAATDEEGNFTLENIEAGSALTASVIGYESKTLYADAEIIEFQLTAEVVEMSGLEVLASRASDKTAVAYTNVGKADMELRLASRDIPMALNTVPSVYATGQGGGAGDARINVRGFNQRNVAIMINGVPVNDMENGWVYWSNWDGLADATTSIQLQKGLSAQNLATPSIGGSMNIITDAAEQERRGLFKQDVGAWGFLKTTLSYHTGLMLDDKLALSGTVVRKTGKGYSFGTWTDAWAYYLGATYNVSDAHKLQFYALGAPQRHGQNLYKQNIATYSHDLAKELAPEYDSNSISEVVEMGRDYNATATALSPSAAALLGDQQWQMYSEYNGARHEDDILNERENFFHKPQVALNHYWTVNENTFVTNSFYWSGGMGGGTGTYGSMKWNYDAYSRRVDYDATIMRNDTNATGSTGILRNSNNRQSTLGLLSKVNYDVNDDLRVQGGIDYRTAKIYHVKTIRDLLGGDYYLTGDSQFAEDNGQGGLGDPIDYNFTNYVNWLGLFGQVEYNSNGLTAFAMGGMTTVKYTHWNHFLNGAEMDATYAGTKDATGADWVEGLGTANGGHVNDLWIEADPISTMQIKGGLLYELGDALSFTSFIPVFGALGENSDIWFNFGLIDKAPIFDQVIQDWDGKMSTDPLNEKFTAFEFGLNNRSNDGSLASKLNFYSTTWADRVATKYIQNEEGDDDIVYLTGIQQSHTGVEFELSSQLNEMFRLDIGVSLGNWVYTDDATGTYRDGTEDKTYGYSIKDLKVGDMPQAGMNLGLTVTPVEGAKVQALYRYYALHYADWDPTTREYSDGDSQNRNLSWRTPKYGILDLNVSYDIPFEFSGVTSQVFLNIINALDELYVQDASDNSKYNAHPWRVNNSTGNAAEVYLGLPTSFNLGLRFNF